MNANTKKIILIVAIVVVLGGFAILSNYKPNQTAIPTNIASNLPVATGTPNTNTTTNTSYKNGTFTGAVSSASNYGDVQVQAIIQNGKITDIKFLQFPNREGHTTEVTSMAEPLLKQEAIAAQSANVDVVSGATQDTQAFIESLQSALDQAKV